MEVETPEDEGIKYSKFTVTEIIFEKTGSGRFPEAVNVENYFLSNKTDHAYSPIALQAALTEGERLALFRVLNAIAGRIEREIKNSL